MALVLRIFDPDTDSLYFECPTISSINFSYGLNSSAQISGELPRNWPNSELIDVGHIVELYDGGNRLIRGFIQQISPNLKETMQFTAVGGIDSVYEQKVFPLAYYDTKPLLGVLVELLNQAGWLIGDISTLDDPDQVVTIDIRSEANLLTQINKLLSGIPEVFYREGQEILGFPSIDIGRFMENSYFQALTPSSQSRLPIDNPQIHWIEDLSYQESLGDSVYAVRSLGGDVRDNLGENRVINLGDAVSGNINLLFDPDFPIIEDLAERNWAALNYRDFGKVGGRVLSTVDGATGTYFGDNAGGGVEQNFWIMQTFLPYPGIFESFSLWFSVISANAVGLTMAWVLQEISISDYRTVIADNLLSGELVLTAAHANTIHKFTIDTEYELVRGKLYGIAFGFSTPPAPDIANVVVKGRAASTSHTFRLQNNIGGKVTTAGVWGAINWLPFLDIVTRPIDRPLASFVSQTASKYAPKNSGAISTLAEVRAAGTSLYAWTKAYLEDHRPSIQSYNLSAVGALTFPKAGSTIYVDGKARGQYIDPLTRKFMQTLRQVNANLRVDRVQVGIEKDVAKFSYNLLSGTGVLRTDLITSLYDETENEEPAAGDVAARPWALLLDTLSTSVGPVSPNSVMSDGTLAYRVSLSIFSGSYASRPNDVEDVFLAGLPYGIISTGGQLRVEMVQLPSLASPEVIFDIALQTRDWEYGDLANITVKQVWR